jgi:hypothetical protein
MVKKTPTIKRLTGEEDSARLAHSASLCMKVMQGMLFADSEARDYGTSSGFRQVPKGIQ